MIKSEIKETYVLKTIPEVLAEVTRLFQNGYCPIFITKHYDWNSTADTGYEVEATKREHHETETP